METGQLLVFLITMMLEVSLYITTDFVFSTKDLYFEIQEF